MKPNHESHERSPTFQTYEQTDGENETSKDPYLQTGQLAEKL